MMVLPFLAAACQRSAAADVPSTDVRRIPEDRKATTPDVIVKAGNAGRVLGSNPTVSILVVSDYQCAECRTWFEKVLPVIRSEYVETGRARLIWVHYPLRKHPAAVRAANAAMCASSQGQFWEASTRLFSTQDQWAAAKDTAALAESLVSLPGMVDYKYRNCVSSMRMLRQIRMDIDWADTNRVGALPHIVVNKRQVPWPSTITALRATIDSVIITPN